ncbi:MAG: trypsin-like peptidase domain-containing protein [Roseobacter sp.]|nr:trypsin-like peptidase domain-containing protein [Roseobacter sp.]
MQRYGMHLITVTAALITLWFAPAPLWAGPLPLLDAESRAQWQAVGRVNGQGYKRLRGCSGTLIAPDLVVTAAHCVGRADGLSRERHFIAGWYRGRFTAHRVSEDIVVHPLYALTEGTARFAYDLALIRLADPIPTRLVAPVPLIAKDAENDGEALLLGYQNSVPHALAGQSDCPLIGTGSPPLNLHLYDCEVVGGTSGGAVILETEQGPVLAAVIVGRAGPEGRALTAPVSEWLRQAWEDAQARAARRP